MPSSLDAMHRSTPQREPVEEGEDHEVEGTGQDERLPKVDRRRKEENRQDQALQEEDAEGAREEHEVSIAGFRRPCYAPRVSRAAGPGCSARENRRRT